MTMPPGEVTDGFRVTTRTSVATFERLRAECMARINKRIEACGLAPTGRVRLRRKRLTQYRSGKQVYCELIRPVEWDTAYQLALAFGTIS